MSNSNASPFPSAACEFVARPFAIQASQFPPANEGAERRESAGADRRTPLPRVRTILPPGGTSRESGSVGLGLRHDGHRPTAPVSRALLGTLANRVALRSVRRKNAAFRLGLKVSRSVEDGGHALAYRTGGCK